MWAVIWLLALGIYVGMVCERFRPFGTDYWRDRYIDNWDALATPDARDSVLINEERIIP